MLRPSYSDLLEVITRDAEDETIGSRYTIVIAAAKRARQLVDNAEPLADEIKVNKPVSIAVQELYESKIKVRQGQPIVEREKGELAEVIFDCMAEEEAAAAAAAAEAGEIEE